jgi:multiple antibiotic resistance protein
MTLLRTFLEVFIPLFVAIDPPGMVPVFLAVTEGMSDERRRRVTFEAVTAATIICLAFMLLGESLFGFLGIRDFDFRIAGGVLLLVLAVYDLLVRGKPAVDEAETVGIFPLAMPLIAGPATLTTTLVLVTKHGYFPTALGLSINFLVLLAALVASGWIARLFGINTPRAVSKLVMVLLAAIAVNLIRVGIAEATSAGAKAHP